MSINGEDSCDFRAITRILGRNICGMLAIEFKGIKRIELILDNESAPTVTITRIVRDVMDSTSLDEEHPFRCVLDQPRIETEKRRIVWADSSDIVSESMGREGS
jgi:hypothetical protein